MSLRRQQVCPKCSGGKLLHVGTMRGHSENGTIRELAVASARRKPRPIDRGPMLSRQGMFDIDGSMPPVEIGQFETLICAACGYAEWFARGLKDDPRVNLAIRDPKLKPERCGECGGTDLCQAHDAFVDWPTVDAFAFVCRLCGFAEWHARRVQPWVPPADGFRCGGCGGRDGSRIDTLTQRGSAKIEWALPVATRAFGPQPGAGHFTCDVCRSCGLMTWYARETEGLGRDHGVTVLEGGVLPSQDGPYR